MHSNDPDRNRLYEELGRHLTDQAREFLMTHLSPEEWPNLVTKSEFEPVAADVAVLKSDVAVLKSDVAVLKSDVGELKTGLIELRTETHVGFADVRTEIHRDMIVHLRWIIATMVALVGIVSSITLAVN